MTLPFRKNIQQMRGYVPGEQPQTDGWVKLNTNENPYPPSPRVVEAIQKAATGRLNIYPDPAVRRFREAASRLFDLDADWILPANGSDENLTILVRAFCDAGDTIVYPYPSYVLYETLAAIQGCSVRRLQLDENFQWSQADAEDVRQSARLTFVPNPNSPTGNLWPSEKLSQVVPDEGILVLDEAYGDFATEPHRGQLLKDPAFAKKTVITRTLSKSYSLAGIRFGFCIGDPELIAGLYKVKDSYNCDTLAIAAATAAIEDQDWMLENRQQILTTRQRLATALEKLGFQVFPSETNFLWTQHPSGQHQLIYEALKEQKVLVRYMQFDGMPGSDDRIDGIRITIGTNSETDRLLEAISVAVAQIEQDS